MENMNGEKQVRRQRNEVGEYDNGWEEKMGVWTKPFTVELKLNTWTKGEKIQKLALVGTRIKNIIKVKR